MEGFSRSYLAVALLLVAGTICVAAIDGAQQKILSSAEFPSHRPPLFKFRTYSDAKQVRCEMNSNGVLFMSVEHKPLKGVTPEMMLWLYDNLENGHSVHPVDKKSYPNFLLFHPRDHIKTTASHHPMSSKGVKTNFIEFPLTGCHVTTNAMTPWVCESGEHAANPGVVQATPNSVWTALSQINGTLDVGLFSSKGIEFRFKGCNEQGQCANVVKTKHAWKLSKTGDALEVTTVNQVGLNMGLARANINPRVLTAWKNGEDPMSKCWRNALHSIEEFGTLEQWLPKAFADTKAKA